MCFINFSNHPHDKWSLQQLEIAKQSGEVIDIPFPMVSSLCDEEDIEKMAQEYVETILLYQPSVVMCQGEFTLAYRVITLLLENNIKVVAACSERVSSEEVGEDGSLRKISVYKFVKYREYRL